MHIYLMIIQIIFTNLRKVNFSYAFKAALKTLIGNEITIFNNKIEKTILNRDTSSSVNVFLQNIGYIFNNITPIIIAVAPTSKYIFKKNPFRVFI